MSLPAMNQVWTLSKFSGTHLLVLLAIADSCNANTGFAILSVSTLAKKVRTGERNVKKILAQLIESGELICEQHPGHSNLYRIGYQSNVAEVSFPKAVNQGQPVNHSSPVNCSSPVNHSSPPREPQFTGRGEPQFTPITLNPCEPMGTQNTCSAVAENPATNPGLLFEEMAPQKNPSKPQTPPKSAATKPTPKKHSSSEPKTPRPRDENWDWLVEVCQLSPSFNNGRLARAKIALEKNHPTPDQRKQFEVYWYAEDWRGQKNQPPTPELVCSEWGKAMRFDKNKSKPKKQETNNYVSPTPEFHDPSTWGPAYWDKPRVQ